MLDSLAVVKAHRSGEGCRKEGHGKSLATRVRRSRKAPKVAGARGGMEWRYPKDISDTNIWDWDMYSIRHSKIFIRKFKKIGRKYTMHKHFTFGCPSHIPSICLHNIFILVKCLVYVKVPVKLPKVANGYGISDAPNNYNLGSCYSTHGPAGAI